MLVNLTISNLHAEECIPLAKVLLKLEGLENLSVDERLKSVNPPYTIPVWLFLNCIMLPEMDPEIEQRGLPMSLRSLSLWTENFVRK